MNLSNPLTYTCDITGICFPVIYRISHPLVHEYSLSRDSVLELPEGQLGLQVDEVCGLGSDIGVDLHLSYFDSEDMASGFIHATQYWHQKAGIHHTRLNHDEGCFVLIAVKGESVKGRVHFNVFKGKRDYPVQAIFDNNGVCIRHPSDC